MNARIVLTKAIKPFCIIGGILIVYALGGFYLLPVVLQSKIPALIEASTGRKSSIAKIEFDPFALRARLQGFKLLETNGAPFVSFDRFYVDLNAFRSIGYQSLVLDTLRLDKPMVRIARLKDGKFNFADLMKEKTEAEKEQSGIFAVMVEHLTVADGQLAWEDDRFDSPINEEISPINLEIDHLSTQSNEQFPLRFNCSLKSGGQLQWQGVAGLQPVTSTGKIKLDKVRFERFQELALQEGADFDLKGTELLELDYKTLYSDKGLELEINKSRIEIQDFGYFEKVKTGIQLKSSNIRYEADYKIRFTGGQWQFSADNTRLELKNIQLYGPGKGKMALDVPEVAITARYQADNGNNRINFSASADGFDLRNIMLTELGHKEPLIKIPVVSAKGIAFDLGKRELSVESVKTEDGQFKAWLEPEGSINYLKFLPEANPEEGGSDVSGAAKPGREESSPWKISLKLFEMGNYEVAFEDRTLKEPVAIRAKPVHFKLTDYTNAEGLSVPLQFSTGFNETGMIKLNGDAVMNPFSARLEVAAKDIELERFQPYVDQYARLDIIDGKWNADGKMSIALPEQSGLDLKFKGSTGIDNLLTRDQIAHKDFVKWKKLTLQEIDADVSAKRYNAGLLLIDKPYGRVIIAKDKTLNVNDILKTGRSTPDKPVKVVQSDPKKQDKTHFKLDRIQIVDGSTDFADLSLILPFAAPIQNLNGGAKGVSSDQRSSVKVALKGNAYDLAPVVINGEVSPYLGDFNVEMHFLGMPMPLVSPYMVQFAGYKVEKGKLTLGLKYQVAKGQLTASNSISIDQFELGEKVENPNAVSVPLELAVALLKDSNGKIKMDVPITGSLEDPQFSVGKIIGDALLNSITKIVTSPFNAIASLIGGEENLDAIVFAPGKAVLEQAQVKKLYGIASALKERPILNIDIKGAAYQEEDWPALREAALYDRLKKMKADEINKKGDKKILAEYVELSDDDYQRLLARLFIEKFPLLADRSLLGTPRLRDPKAGDFYVIAKQKLAEVIKPDPNRLTRLASRRAQAIAKYLVQQGGVQNDRVFILDPVVDPPRENKDIISFLTLKTK